jgi:hypothetical protein
VLALEGRSCLALDSVGAADFLSFCPEHQSERVKGVSELGQDELHLYPRMGWYPPTHGKDDDGTV